MALTQEQKTTISSISQYPDEILQTFHEKPHYLQSFKNEFYQDGTGLLDKVLYQYFLTEKQIFLNLYQYIVEKSTISITDNKGNKPSALSYLYNLKHSFKDFSFYFEKVIKHLKAENIGYHGYVIESHIVDLYNQDYKDLAINNVKKFRQHLSGYKKLLVSVVKSDDISFFKEVFNLESDKLLKINFNNSAPEKSLLFFCLENNAYGLSDFLLNHYPNILNYEQPTLYSVGKKLPPILDVAKNSPLFDKIISLMSDKQFAYNLNYFNDNSERLLTNLLNKHYSNNLEEKIILNLQSSIDNYAKINVIKSVFESDISYNKKFFIFSSGLEEDIKEIYSHIAVFNSFIFSVQKNPDISQNLFDQFINEFKLRNLISEDYVFNSVYFSNIKYFKLVNNNHVFNKINPLNFVEPYLKNNKCREITDDTDYIWFKIAQLDLSKLNYNSNTLNSLHLMLVNNIDKYVNFFTQDKLNLFLKNNFNISSYRKNDSSKDFFSIVDKLLNVGLSFKEDKTAFLKLLSFNAPTILLDKIIKKDNVSIEELSKEDYFWSSINNQSTFDYCLYHKAHLNIEKHLVSLCYNYNTLPLELYLKNNGTVSYEDDKGNILHYLCQYNGELKDEEILLLLDFHPDLAIKINKQNKFPVSYLITDFNRMCKKYNENSLKISNQKALEKPYKVIKSMFQCGLHTDNKKAFNILESQLLKYHDILETFPELLALLRAEKLSRKLEVKGIKTKTIKI